jgi:membrane protein YdbS with pleckstrin-like domain
MAEETVWRGHSSQWQNIGRFAWAGLIAVGIVVVFFIASAFFPPGIHVFATLILLLLVAPIIMAATAFLQTKTRSYELTTERLKTTSGIFTKVTETLELYRVKDIETRQPFFYRMMGLETVQLNTSDASSPIVLIDAVPSSAQIADKTRNQVEIIRTQKRVREIDIE